MDVKHLKRLIRDYIIMQKNQLNLLHLIDVINLKDNKQTALVLSEEKHHDIVAKHAYCELKVFEPYLKDKKKFYLYGFGPVCKN